MQYFDFQDLKLSALRFGAMRLPVIGGAFAEVCPQQIDIPEALADFTHLIAE